MAKTTKKKAEKARSGAKAAAVAGPPRQPGVERRQSHPMRAKNGFMHVLLTHDVPHVGKPGELVRVRPGFARNYLLPQGLATFATPHNLRIVERHKERLRQIEEAKRADLLNLAAQISQRAITIEANANEEGHLYGSVNADQIATALQADNLPIETENVRLEGPLRELGLYTIQLHLGQDINAEVKLWVVPTHSEDAES